MSCRIEIPQRRSTIRRCIATFPNPVFNGSSVPPFSLGGKKKEKNIQKYKKKKKKEDRKKRRIDLEFIKRISVSLIPISFFFSFFLFLFSFLFFFRRGVIAHRNSPFENHRARAATGRGGFHVIASSGCCCCDRRANRSYSNEDAARSIRAESINSLAINRLRPPRADLHGRRK